MSLDSCLGNEGVEPREGGACPFHSPAPRRGRSQPRAPARPFHRLVTCYRKLETQHNIKMLTGYMDTLCCFNFWKGNSVDSNCHTALIADDDECIPAAPIILDNRNPDMLVRLSSILGLDTLRNRWICSALIIVILDGCMYGRNREILWNCKNECM